MEAIPAQQEPTLTLRQQILKDPDFDILLINARKLAKEKPPKKSLRDTIIEDPDFDVLLRNAWALAKNEKKPARSGFSKLARAAVVTAGVLTATGGVAYAERDKIGDKLLETGRKFETSDVVYPSKVFVGGTQYSIDTPTASPSPTPTETPVPTPSPTPEPTAYPKALAEKEVGERNAAEFFLGDLVKQFKERRSEKFQKDPEFARRIQKEFLNSDRINILYLGIDQIRGRGEPNNEGLGRADSIMVISFDPHTFKTTTISIPRDLYSPEVARHIPEVPKINGMTVIPEGGNFDANKFVKEIIENATGIPIDWIIKTNVDFIYNSEGVGIFDDLFPDGLEINVPDDIVDVDAPVVDGKPGLLFEKGLQKMNGGKIMRYATERRADSDYGRADRQRQVVRVSMMTLLPSIITNLVDGNTQTLDKIVSALERQKNSFNLFYDVDLIEVAKTMRDNLTNLRKTPKGIVVLGVLAANTIDEIKNIRENRAGMFTSFGFSTQNDLMGVAPDEGYELSMSKPRGSSLQNQPSRYYIPTRQRVLDLLK